MHLRYDAHRTGSVTKYHTRNIASASSSPVNAIESILLLVCVVILFSLFHGHASDGIQQLCESWFPSGTQISTERGGTFCLHFSHLAERVRRRLLVDKQPTQQRVNALEVHQHQSV